MWGHHYTENVRREGGKLLSGRKVCFCLKVEEKMEIILKNSFALSNVVVRFLEIPSCLTCQSINPLACTECGDSLLFSGASSIPPCHTLFPATPLCQSFFHPPSLHPATYFLVYLLVLLFPDSYTILFWESYFLPFSVHIQTSVLSFCLYSAWRLPKPAMFHSKWWTFPPLTNFEHRVRYSTLATGLKCTAVYLLCTRVDHGCL